MLWDCFGWANPELGSAVQTRRVPECDLALARPSQRAASGVPWSKHVSSRAVSHGSSGLVCIFAGNMALEGEEVEDYLDQASSAQARISARAVKLRA